MISWFASTTCLWAAARLGCAFGLMSITGSCATVATQSIMAANSAGYAKAFFFIFLSCLGLTSESGRKFIIRDPNLGLVRQSKVPNWTPAPIDPAQQLRIG